MKKFYNTVFLIIMPFLFSACFMDHIKVYTSGIVLDYETKKPISGVLIKDLEYGGTGVESDCTGRFKLLGVKKKRIIEATILGYKPFHLEMFTKYKHHKHYEYYVVTNEEHWSEYGPYELNSNCFKVTNNDSLIIELEKR